MKASTTPLRRLGGRLLFALPMVLLTAATALTAQGGAGKRNYDARESENVGYHKAPSASQLTAVKDLKDRMPRLEVRFDRTTGVTARLSNRRGYLSDPRPGVDAGIVARDFIQTHLKALGLDKDDFEGFEVTDRVFSQATGATRLYLRQRHAGLAGFNCQLQVNINRNGRVMSVNNAFMPQVRRATGRTKPRLSASEAVQKALEDIGSSATAPQALSAPVGTEQITYLDHSGLSSREIEARLVWVPVRHGRARLAWNFAIHTLDDQHAYDINVDARDGKVWTRFDWVSADSYRVYADPAESPNHTAGRTLVSNPAHATASPLGWHDTGSSSFTIMRGNNVHAYEDSNASNSPPASQPSCGAGLNCDFPINLAQAPSTYTSAAIANLFYWNNHIHDVQYQYGFDEAAGNFQVNNFGKGGIGGDDVRAEAQDGGGTNNANFSTPPDGNRARMQMFIWTPTNPDRDGDLDNGIVTHEYGHGISTRQVGGPSNSSCLNNSQQPGEGWSDWFALAYTAEVGDQGTDKRGIGTYALGEPTSGDGIRTQPYSTSSALNTHTYASIAGMAIPHGVGEVWGQALWEVYWALVGAHGFNSDLLNPAGFGNQRAMLYVNEGLKNTACSPTFIDARDGVLQAVQDNFGGEDLCLVWGAFADFGLGVSASTPGPNSTSATNGFDVPAFCSGPPPPPPPPSTCAAGSLDFNSFTLQAYSNQDGSGTVTVEDGGDTLFMQGNRWRRSAQSFAVTANTVVEFEFSSDSQGEIHGIGFDEDNTLNNAQRIFEFYGTQNWGNAFQFTPRYTGNGAFQSFTIPIGQSYTGGAMRLVFTNDKDAGAATNTSRFRCVRVFEDTGGGGNPVTVYSTNFDVDAGGFTKTGGATDLWRLATDCVTAASGARTLAFSRAAPNCDYDVGTAQGTATSPVIDASGFATATVQFVHQWQTESFNGQFDRMFIEVSTNGGGTWSVLKEINSSNANPAGFVSESFAVTPSAQLQIRFRFDSVDGTANNFLGWYVDDLEVIGQ